MIIKVIIPCWPSFKKASQKCLRESIINLVGNNGLNDLDQGEGKGCTLKMSDMELRIFSTESWLLSIARNRGINSLKDCVKKYQIIDDCDFCLFVDADTGFNLKNIIDLVSINAPVIGGAYKYRFGKNVNNYVAGYWRKSNPGLIESCVEGLESTIVRVDWAGGGFLLVHHDVFSKIEYPWFYYGVIDSGDEATELGEDMGFALKCKQVNIPILVHCGLNPPLIHRQD